MWILNMNAVKKLSSISITNMGVTGQRFRSIGLDRRQAMSEVVALKGRQTGMFTNMNAVDPSEAQIQLPLMSLSEHVIHGYSSMALSLKAPLFRLREASSISSDFQNRKPCQCNGRDDRKGRRMVLVRQRPVPQAGYALLRLRMKQALPNLVVFETLFEKYRKEILNSRLLMVEGKLQIEGEVIHVIVKRYYDLSQFLRQLTEVEADAQSLQTLARADERDGYPHHGQNKRSRVRTVVQKEIFLRGRNFK